MSMYDEDNYEPEIYYIPGNVADNGNVVGGMLKLRNMIEAIVLGLIMAGLWRIIFYAFGLVVKTIAFGIMVLPIVAAALIGIQGESLIEWFIEFFYFHKKKRMMIFEIPRPESIKKKRFGKKEKGVETQDMATGEEIDTSNMSQKELKALKKQQRKQAKIDAKRMEQEAKQAKKEEKAARKAGKKDFSDSKKEKGRKKKQAKKPLSGNIRT